MYEDTSWKNHEPATSAATGLDKPIPDLNQRTIIVQPTKSPVRWLTLAPHLLVDIWATVALQLAALPFPVVLGSFATIGLLLATHILVLFYGHARQP